MPTLNEGRNLEHVLRRMPADLYELILVDGHSTDDTVEVARRLRRDIKVVVQNRRGKGNALICGFAVATGDVIVMIDADGSTDPIEIPRFVEALECGADFAKGSRFVQDGGSFDITRTRKLGNTVLVGLVNVLFGTRFTDLCYGYNAFRRHCLQVFDLDVGDPGDAVWGDGFEIEALLCLRVARAGARIAEVASIEQQRVYGSSNLNAFRDGWRVLRTIERERRRIAERLGSVVASASDRARDDATDRAGARIGLTDRRRLRVDQGYVSGGTPGEGPEMVIDLRVKESVVADHAVESEDRSGTRQVGAKSA
jgi:glycosyltransferase involved in cell wall biosynthesis